MAKAARTVRRQTDSPASRGWILLDQSDPLLWRKEVIYAGDFAKLDAKGDGLEFAARRSALKHWADSVHKLLAAGIRVPYAKSHDTWDDPEDKLGDVVAADVETNAKGRDSLFATIRFADEQSKRIALKGDVSIGSPPVWYDGNGRKWIRPFQHLAATNSPVIPGLESWQKLAASFANGGSTMELDELIELLGIEVDEEIAGSDDAKKALIKQKLMELVGKPAKPAEGEGEGMSPEDVDMSHEEDEAEQRRKRAAAAAAQQPSGGNGGTNVPQAKKVTVAFSHPVVVRTVRDARMAQLDALVDANTITPNVKSKLAEKFCTEDGIKLELSHQDEDSTASAFEDALELVKLTAKDRPLKASGRTPAGDLGDDSVIELSHGQKRGSLVKAMEKMAESYKRN